MKREQFYDEFEEAGYDTLEILKDLDEEELEELIDDVGMKKGHAKKFLRALESLELPSQDESSLEGLNSTLALQEDQGCV